VCDCYRGRRWVGDFEAEFFKLAGRGPGDRAEGCECELSGFAAAAHFAQADESVICFDFNNGSDESAPMAAVGVSQRGFEWDGDGGCADVGDFHSWLWGGIVIDYTDTFA